MKPGEQFVCVACGRRQMYQPQDKPGGITEDEARVMGWFCAELGDLPPKWLCPFCAPTKVRE